MSGTLTPTVTGNTGVSACYTVPASTRHALDKAAHWLLLSVRRSSFQ